MENVLLSIQRITTIIEISMREVNAIIERTLKGSREKQAMMNIQSTVQKIVPTVNLISQKSAGQSLPVKLQPQEVSSYLKELKSKKTVKKKKIMDKTILTISSPNLDVSVDEKGLKTTCLNKKSKLKDNTTAFLSLFEENREKQIKESSFSTNQRAIEKKTRKERNSSKNKETKSLSKQKPKGATKNLNKKKPHQPHWNLDLSFDVSKKKKVSKSLNNLSFDVSDSLTLSFSEVKTANKKTRNQIKLKNSHVQVDKILQME